MIHIVAFDDFGIADILVLIQDEKGNRIESDDAGQWLECPEMWNYMTMAAVPSGTSVLVSVIATNQLGAVSVCSEKIKIP